MSSLVRAYLFFYTSLGKNDSYIEIRVTGNWDEPLQRRSNNLYAILCRYTKLKTSWWKDLHLCIKRLGFGCSYAHFTYLNRIKNCQLYHHRQWKSRQIILDFRSKIKIWALIRKKNFTQQETVLHGDFFKHVLEILDLQNCFKWEKSWLQRGM